MKKKEMNRIYSFVAKVVFCLVEPTHLSTTFVAVSSLIHCCFSMHKLVGIDAGALFSMLRSKAGMRVFNAILESYGMSPNSLPYKPRKKGGSQSKLLIGFAYTDAALSHPVVSLSL